MLQAKCPYVERTGSCYVRASCHFCNFHSILTRFVNAPAFTPATKPKTAPFNDDDLLTSIWMMSRSTTTSTGKSRSRGPPPTLRPTTPPT